MMEAAAQMPDVFHRIGVLFKDWARTRGIAAISKLPRERPDLLPFVFIAAGLLLGLYAAVFAKGL